MSLIPGAVVEAGGHAFIPLEGYWGLRPRGHVTGPMGAGLAMADGTRPPWWPASPDVAVVDDVAVLTDGPRAVAVDIETGVELWASEPGRWMAESEGESLYLVSAVPAEIRRVDLRTGVVRWSAPLGASGQADWLPTNVSTFWHADPVMVLSDVTEEARGVVRFDAATGREVMRHELPPGSEFVQAFVGEGQLVVLAYQPDSSEGGYAHVARGIDPASGELRWARTFEGAAGVLGRHLVSDMEADDGIRRVFYR